FICTQYRCLSQQIAHRSRTGIPVACNRHASSFVKQSTGRGERHAKAKRSPRESDRHRIGLSQETDFLFCTCFQMVCGNSIELNRDLRTTRTELIGMDGDSKTHFFCFSQISEAFSGCESRFFDENIYTLAELFLEDYRK